MSLLFNILSRFVTTFLPQSKCLLVSSWFAEVQVQLPKWHRGQEPLCQCRRCKRRGFDPWVKKIPWSRKWQPAPVLLPGKFHGQRSLAGYSPQNYRVGHSWAQKLQVCLGHQWVCPSRRPPSSTWAVGRAGVWADSFLRGGRRELHCLSRRKATELQHSIRGDLAWVTRSPESRYVWLKPQGGPPLNTRKNFLTLRTALSEKGTSSLLGQLAPWPGRQ